MDDFKGSPEPDRRHHAPERQNSVQPLKASKPSRLREKERKNALPLEPFFDTGNEDAFDGERSRLHLPGHFPCSRKRKSHCPLLRSVRQCSSREGLEGKPWAFSSPEGGGGAPADFRHFRRLERPHEDSPAFPRHPSRTQNLSYRKTGQAN